MKTSLTFRWTATVILAGLFLPTPTLAGEIGDALEKVKVERKAALKRAADALDSAFEKVIKKVAETGDLDAVKALMDAQKKYKSDRTIPESEAMKDAVKAYLTARRKASGKLVLAYRAAVKEYTKKLKIDEATATREEMNTFFDAEKIALGLKKKSASKSKKGKKREPPRKKLSEIVEALKQAVEKASQGTTEIQRREWEKTEVLKVRKKYHGKANTSASFEIHNIQKAREGKYRVLVSQPVELAGVRGYSFPSTIECEIPSEAAAKVNAGDYLVFTGRVMVVDDQGGNDLIDRGIRNTFYMASVRSKASYFKKYYIYVVNARYIIKSKDELQNEEQEEMGDTEVDEKNLFPDSPQSIKSKRTEMSYTASRKGSKATIVIQNSPLGKYTFEIFIGRRGGNASGHRIDGDPSKPKILVESENGHVTKITWDGEPIPADKGQEKPAPDQSIKIAIPHDVPQSIITINGVPIKQLGARITPDVEGRTKILEVPLQQLGLQITKNVIAYYNRGEAWYLNGKYDKAIADFSKAIKINPKYAFAYDYRGAAWRHKGDHDKAIADFSQAIKINPKYANTYSNRGVAWLLKGENDKAIADFSKSIKLNPNGAMAHSNRGAAWSKKGEYDKAIADCSQAIKINPKHAEAYSHRGVAWSKKGEYDKAIADFSQAIKINPKYAKDYHNRGEAWKKLGQAQRAAADFAKEKELREKE